VDFFASTGDLKAKDSTAPGGIVDKARVVRELGESVVCVGQGYTDAEMMEYGEIGIAFGKVHQPAVSVMAACDYVVFSETALCRLLRRLA
jgi:phosphoserine phosphatase